jgi:hypothetical protein
MKATLAAGFLLVAVALALLIANQLHRERQNERLDQQHREFCMFTKQAMHEDAMDFASADTVLHEYARARFINSQIIYHGSQSILMCTDKLPKIPTACVANADWSCMAGIAHDVEQAIE